MHVNCLRIAGYIAVFALAFCLQAQGVQAQPLPLAPDLKTQKVVLHERKQAFTQVLSTLSQKIGRSIFADDDPLLAQADIDSEGTAQDALDKIADTFDYTWTLSKSGIVLMNKRFNNPEEFPQVNRLEMAHMAQSVVDVMSGFRQQMTSRHMLNGLNDLAGSFTPLQMQLLRSGKGLTYSDLAPEQQRELQGVILSHVGITSAGSWLMLKGVLDVLPRCFLQVREWPTFYQKQSHMPVVSFPNVPNQAEFGLFGPPVFGTEVRIPLRHDLPTPTPQVATQQDKRGGKP